MYWLLFEFFWRLELITLLFVRPYFLRVYRARGIHGNAPAARFPREYQTCMVLISSSLTCSHNSQDFPKLRLLIYVYDRYLVNHLMDGWIFNNYNVFLPVFNKANGSAARGERLPAPDLRAAGGEHPGLGACQPPARGRPFRRQETH